MNADTTITIGRTEDDSGCTFHLDTTGDLDLDTIHQMLYVGHKMLMYNLRIDKQNKKGKKWKTSRLQSVASANLPVSATTRKPPATPIPKPHTSY